MKFDLKTPPNRRRAVFVQMVAGYLNKAVIIIQGLLLIPLYLSFIGDRMYGLWLASGGVIAWLTFMDLGIGTLLTQRVSNAYGREEYREAGSYFINGFIVYLGLSALFYLALLGVSFYVSGWFGATGEQAFILRSCFQLAGIAAGTEMINNCLRGFAGALQRPIIPMAAMTVFRIIGLAATVVFLYCDFKLWAIPIGLIVYSVPTFLVNLVCCIALVNALSGKWQVKRDIVREFFNIAPALSAGKIGSSLVSNIEPTLIAMILRPELAPAFVITRRAGEMVVQLLTVILGAVLPSYSHLYAGNREEVKKEVLSKIFLLIFTSGTIGFSVYTAANKPFIILWTGADQYLGNEMTLMIAAGLFLSIIKQALFGSLVYMGDVTVPPLMDFSEALLRVVLMIALVYGIGMVGLPVGMILSVIVFLYFYYQRLDKRIPMNFFRQCNWIKAFSFTGILFGFGYLACRQAIDIESWAGFFIYAIAISTLLVISGILLSLKIRRLLISTLKLYFQREL